jgi:hypothetical protein
MNDHTNPKDIPTVRFLGAIQAHDRACVELFDLFLRYLPTDVQDSAAFLFEFALVKERFQNSHLELVKAIAGIYRDNGAKGHPDGD